MPSGILREPKMPAMPSNGPAPDEESSSYETSSEEEAPAPKAPGPPPVPRVSVPAAAAPPAVKHERQTSQASPHVADMACGPDEPYKEPRMPAMLDVACQTKESFFDRSVRDVAVGPDEPMSGVADGADVKDPPQRVSETRPDSTRSGHVEQTSLPDVPIVPVHRKKRRKHLKEKEDTGEVHTDPQIDALSAHAGAGPDSGRESKKDEHKDDEDHEEHKEHMVTEPVLPPDTLATAAKELPAVPAVPAVPAPKQRAPETNAESSAELHNDAVPFAELKPTSEAMDASHRPKTLGSVRRSPSWASRPSRPSRPSRSRSMRLASPRPGLRLQLRSAPRSRSRRREPQAKVKGGCAISPKRGGSADPPHRRDPRDRADRADRVSKVSRSRRVPSRRPRRRRSRRSRGSRGFVRGRRSPRAPHSPRSRRSRRSPQRSPRSPRRSPHRSHHRRRPDSPRRSQGHRSERNVGNSLNSSGREQTKENKEKERENKEDKEKQEAKIEKPAEKHEKPEKAAPQVEVATERGAEKGSDRGRETGTDKSEKAQRLPERPQRLPVSDVSESLKPPGKFSPPRAQKASKAPPGARRQILMIGQKGDEDDYEYEYETASSSPERATKQGTAVDKVVAAWRTQQQQNYLSAMAGMSSYPSWGNWSMPNMSSTGHFHNQLSTYRGHRHGASTSNAYPAIMAPRYRNRGGKERSRDEVHEAHKVKARVDGNPPPEVKAEVPVEVKPEAALGDTTFSATPSTPYQSEKSEAVMKLNCSFMFETHGASIALLTLLIVI
eukprot:s724_g12.t2